MFKDQILAAALLGELTRLLTNQIKLGLRKVLMGPATHFEFEPTLTRLTVAVEITV